MYAGKFPTSSGEPLSAYSARFKEADRSLRRQGKKKFIAFRDAFLREFGTALCPELQKRIFGRSFVFTDESQGAEFFAIADDAEKCAEIMGKAARVAAEILLADEE